MSRDMVLIVDDERNIRLTVSQALEQLDVEVAAAVNAEEALQLLRKERVSLLLLDLKMPGMDGMELLRTLRKQGNEVKVVIITAHGTIENAVEAMKLGAVDFLQKPFTPEEIRGITSKALKRKEGFFRRIAFEHEILPEAALRTPHPARPEEVPASYDDCLEQMKAAIESRDFDGAMPWIKRAISLDPSRPEGYNILGVLHEIKNETLEAQKYYRASLSVDPTYEPASRNLLRTTGRLPDDIPEIGLRSAKSGRPRGFGGLFRRAEKRRGAAKE